MGSILEWEENIFLGLKALYKRVFVHPEKQKSIRVRACLEPIRQELFVLANLFAGSPVKILTTPKSILCSETRLFLPDFMDVADSTAINYELYRFKTISAGIVIQRLHQTKGSQAFSAQECVRDAVTQYPGLADLWNRLETQLASSGEDLWKLLGEPVRLNNLEEPELLGNLKDLALKPQELTEMVTEIQGKGQIDVQPIEDNGDQPVEAEMPIHTFEKAEALEEYNGNSRKTDDDDELKDHEEALNDIDMRHVLRSAERPKSIYKADMLMPDLALECEDSFQGKGYPYPEWNYKKRSFRENWCYVQPKTQKDGSLDWVNQVEVKHRKVIRDIKRRMAALTTQELMVKRQYQGPEFDIDAVVGSYLDSRVGAPPDEKIYCQKKKTLHDVSVLILLDQSYSTDSWVNNERVLNVICETIFCVGEALDETIEGFAIAGFSSNTRRQCEFNLIKGFQEPWVHSRKRLGCIDPRGYTRIGPALRHAHKILEKQTTERRMIYLMTDGRPCDYDQYEGEYGVQDVCKAVESAERSGILTHAFTIDHSAREHFPKMFRTHYFEIVSDSASMARGICNSFMRMRLR